MALQGISVGGTVYRYDYNYLDNKPALGDFLPEVTSSDAGKVLQVDNSGNWGASSGGSGSNGVTFTPSVDSSGNLSWTNDGNLSNPETVNIKGADATINGVNALTIAAGNNVTLSQSGSTLTINSSGAISTIKVNGYEVPIIDKTVSLSIPRYTTALTNNSDFQTKTQVLDAINKHVASAYKIGGSATLATLPALTAPNLGMVYSMSEGFTTTSNFMEGAGKAYPAGTNVVVALTRPIIGAGLGWILYSDGQFVLSGDNYTATEEWEDYASQITSVVVASGVTEIAAYSFYNYENIASVYIPLSVIWIGDGNFHYPDNVYYEGTLAQWYEISISNESNEQFDAEVIHYGATMPTVESPYKYDVLSGFIDVQSLQAENALLRELIRGMEAACYRTASGNPVTFSDGYAANVRTLKVTITPTQSGTPSVENPVAITGVSAVSVTRTGENGANPQTVTVSLTDGNNALTVYGGTLNVTTGELIVTHGSVSSYDGVTAVPDGWISSTGQLSAGAQIIYPLAAADYQSYTLTGQNLSALYGENTFSANAGSVTVEYRADVTLSLPTSS